MISNTHAKGNHSEFKTVTKKKAFHFCLERMLLTLLLIKTLKSVTQAIVSWEDIYHYQPPVFFYFWGRGNI